MSEKGFQTTGGGLAGSENRWFSGWLNPLPRLLYNVSEAQGEAAPVAAKSCSLWSQTISTASHDARFVETPLRILKLVHKNAGHRRRNISADFELLLVPTRAFTRFQTTSCEHLLTPKRRFGGDSGRNPRFSSSFRRNVRSYSPCLPDGKPGRPGIRSSCMFQ
jgi:hypothetical protein